MHREASGTSTTTKQANITDSAKRNPPLVQDVATSGMSIIRTKIERNNISDTAKDIIMASWREGTKKNNTAHTLISGNDSAQRETLIG